jgi:hypothetical protein
MNPIPNRCKGVSSTNLLKLQMQSVTTITIYLKKITQYLYEHEKLMCAFYFVKHHKISMLPCCSWLHRSRWHLLQKPREKQALCWMPTFTGSELLPRIWLVGASSTSTDYPWPMPLITLVPMSSNTNTHLEVNHGSMLHDLIWTGGDGLATEEERN